MPISPYYAQNGYGTRNYVRSSSSGNLAGMGTTYYNPGDVKGVINDHSSNYFRSKYIIPEDGPAKSYLTARYNQPPPPRSAFQLKRLDSSDSLYDRRNPLEENRIKKSTSTSSFLTGNTPSYLRNNDASDAYSRTLPYTPKPRAFTSNLPSPTETSSSRPFGERQFPPRSGGQSSYARAYLDRINKGRDDRPREIDTRDINTSVPRTAKWLKIEKSEDDAGDISRNRQVVRLTIKREKAAPQDPFTIRDKKMQTIAQRLLEKYQVPDKKPDPPRPKPAVRRTFYLDSSPPPAEKSAVTPIAVTSKPPKPSSSTPATPVSTHNPLLLQLSSMTPGAVQRVPSSSEEDKEDMSLVLQRATNTAETKEELESWQEVKDAIYAAVLHPDVDIESDEEMNKLIEGKSPPRKSSGIPEEVKMKLEEPRRDSMDKGLAIVGQLKRFVKQHESTSCSTKKRSKKLSRGSKKAKTSEEGSADRQDGEVITPETTESSQERNTYTPAISETDNEKKQKEKVSPSSGATVERIEESKPAGNTASVGKEEGLSDSSTSKEKTGKEKESSVLSTSLVLENEATPGNEPTKTIRGYTGQCQKIPEKSGATCVIKEKLQEALPSKTKNKGVSSPLSADLVLGSQGHGRQDGVAEASGANTCTTELDNTLRKTETSPTVPGINEGTKDVSGTKIPKIKKKMKTSAAAAKEVSGDTLGPSGTRAVPPSVLPLGSPSSSSSPADSPLTQDAPRETHKKQSRDTPAQARTADTQTSDRQMESPSALETLKSIMREEVECVAAKDSPSVGKTKQVTAENSTSDAAAELETSRDGGPCLTKGHKNEKAVKVESSEHLEGAEKGSDAKLSSPASKQEKREKTAGVGKTEVKPPKEQKNDENDVAKDAVISSKTQTLPKQDRKNEGMKLDPLPKASAIPKWMAKDKKAVTEAKVEVKQKEGKIISETDETSITKKNETTSGHESKAETQDNSENKGHDKSRVSAAVKAEEQKDESDKKSQGAADSSERGRDKEDVMNLKGKAKPTQTASEGAGAEGGAPPNVLPVKKVMKRPRQVAPPPVSEKDTANELLKARNILKRPVKPGVAAPTETSKQDTENKKEVMTRPAWRKPISQPVPPSQGDQSVQVKIVLKRSEKEKEEEKVSQKLEAAPDADLKKPVKMVPTGSPAPQTESKEGGEDGKGTRGRVLRKQKPAYSRSASSSSDEDDGGSTVRKKAEKPKKIIKPISGVKKTPSPKGDTHTPGVPETTAGPKTPPGSTPSTSFPEKSETQQPGGKTCSEEKQEGGNVGGTTKEGQMVKKSTLEPKENKGLEVVKDKAESQGGAKEEGRVGKNATGVTKTHTGMEEAQVGKVEAQESPKGVTGAKGGTVGASQSADSGYGSSPSTPLPTPTPAAPIKDEEEEKCEGK